MKILEMYAKQWLIKHIKPNKTVEDTVIEFAKEVERLMGITEEAKEDEN